MHPTFKLLKQFTEFVIILK